MSHSLFASFNSKLVRLEGLTDITSVCILNSFNSKLVRLEVPCQRDREITMNMFQFQTGLIRSVGHTTFVNLYLSFNSKLVRLEAKMREFTLWKEQPGFNSKLVRLEELTAKATYLFRGCFNSKLVRLEVAASVSIFQDGTVSIPNWFD